MATAWMYSSATGQLLCATSSLTIPSRASTRLLETCSYGCALSYSHVCVYFSSTEVVFSEPRCLHNHSQRRSDRSAHGHVTLLASQFSNSRRRHPLHMPKSEIDDIFAGKADPPIASSSVVQEKKKKKKKKAKDKDAGQANTDEPPVQTAAKRRLPETVVDTSAKLEAPPAKRAKVERSSAVAPSDVSKKKKGKKADKDEEADFRDSRGTGPRTLLMLPVSDAKPK
ncbi:hypothetical protein OE88DRAFT_1803894 [Heliocybe sulcata]|uniref:Uncharacterized protein n=1 Tax=Heliocybe sulcata TaxID=5364 RepID=A0A5C3NUA6_9AGAM|nr:hypothetical protein OE88DRAFT_1803894 [Heliocybe sulcata]